MKNWIALFVLLLIFLVGIFIGKGCEGDEPVDYSGRISELEQDTTRAGIVRDSLEHYIDSLENVPDVIWKQVIVKLDTIDRRIEKDSTQAIVTFREGLQLWNWLPDKADYPTYRELGLMAKIAVEGNGYKLKVKLYEEQTIPTLKADIKNHKVLYQSSQDLLKIKDLSLDAYKSQVEDANSFWHNDYLWFGLGVLASGITVYLVK